VIHFPLSSKADHFVTSIYHTPHFAAFTHTQYIEANMFFKFDCTLYFLGYSWLNFKMRNFAAWVAKSHM
jgi:hypothetical protein